MTNASEAHDGYLLADVNFGQLAHTLVVDLDDARVGLDGAEGEVGRLRRLAPCKRVEQRALADVGQPDDARLEAAQDYPRPK